MSGSRERWPAIVVGAGIALCVVFCAIHSLRLRNPDPFAYAVAARGVLEGKLLYRDIWQDKPPLGILVYALPELIARGSNLAESLVLAAVLAAHATMFYRTLARDHAHAACAGALAILLGPMMRDELAWLSTDHVANLGGTWLLLAGWRIRRDGAATARDCLAIGIATALTFCVRQTGVVFALAPLYAIARCTPWRRWSPPLARISLGAALGLAGVVLLTLPMIGAREAFYTVVIYPMKYAAERQSAFGIANAVLVEEHYGAVVIAVFLLALRSPRRGYVAIAALCGVLAVWLPHKPWEHYAAGLLPPFALAVFAVHDGAVRARWLRSAIAGMIAVIAIQDVRVAARIASLPLDDYRLRIDEGARLLDAQPDGTVLVADGSGRSTYLYFLTRHPPAGVYYLGFQIDGFQGKCLDTTHDEILEGYRRSPPDLLVVPLHRYPRFGATESVVDLGWWFVDGGTFELAGVTRDWRVYRRKRRRSRRSRRACLAR